MTAANPKAVASHPITIFVFSIMRVPSPSSVPTNANVQ